MLLLLICQVLRLVWIGGGCEYYANRCLWVRSWEVDLHTRVSSPEDCCEGNLAGKQVKLLPLAFYIQHKKSNIQLPNST